VKQDVDVKYPLANTNQMVKYSQFIRATLWEDGGKTPRIVKASALCGKSGQLFRPLYPFYWLYRKLVGPTPLWIQWWIEKSHRPNEYYYVPCIGVRG